MSRQFIRLPGYLEDRIAGMDPYALKILTHLFSRSFYNDTGYSPVFYSSQEFANELGISKPNITERMKYLTENGYISRNGKDIFLTESPGQFPSKSKGDLLSSQKVNKINFSHKKVNEINEKSKPDLRESKGDLRNEEKKLTTFTLSPLYARLEKGFETPLVLIQYLYSKINSSMVVDDFVNFILNCHDFDWIKEIRMKKGKPPIFAAMQKNQRFLDNVKWFHEIFAKTDEETQKKNSDYKTMPLFNYVIYSFIDAILQDENPMGRFIKVCDDLKSSKKRIPFGILNEVLHCEEEELSKANLQKRIENTDKMFGEQVDWIAKRKTEAEERKALLNKYEKKCMGEWKGLYDQAVNEMSEEMIMRYPTKYDLDGNNLEEHIKQEANRSFEVKLAKLINQRLEGLI
jgi:hypothetical protein